MSGTTKTNARCLAVLKLPEDHVPQLVVQARSIVDSMTGNLWFLSPRPSLASVAAAVEALSEAQTATLRRTVGAVAERDEKRLAVVVLLQELLAYVQATADADEGNAAVIIESAGMSVKRPRLLPPRVFVARPGPVAGSVELVAPQAGHRAGYEWAQSTDSGSTWTSLPFTVRASTSVSGFAPGATVHFRYRPVTKDGTGDWSQTVSIVVG